MVPKDGHILIPRTCEGDFTCQKGLCRYDSVKDLEMGVILDSPGVLMSS